MALRGTWGWALVLVAWNGAAQTPPLTEAERLIEAGHWKRARALVEGGARRNPDALTSFLLSQIRNAFGDRESPLPLAERAVAMDGKVAKYHRQVAEAVGLMAQHAGWLQQFVLARRFRREIDTALAQDPRDLQALGDLMEFYLVAPGFVGGDKDRARATAERIAAVDRVRGFSAQARLAEANGEIGKVDLMLHKAVEAGPGSYRARVALAAWLLSHGNLEEARAQAAEAARIDPTRVDAYALLAVVYVKRNQTGELEAVLTAAEQQVPDDLLPYYRSAEALRASGQNLARAERYLRRYLAAEPEGNEPTLSEAHWKLGQVLERERHTAEAAGGQGSETDQ